MVPKPGKQSKVKTFADGLVAQDQAVDVAVLGIGLLQQRFGDMRNALLSGEDAVEQSDMPFDAQGMQEAGPPQRVAIGEHCRLDGGGGRPMHAEVQIKSAAVAVHLLHVVQPIFTRLFAFNSTSNMLNCSACEKTAASSEISGKRSLRPVADGCAAEIALFMPR